MPHIKSIIRKRKAPDKQKTRVLFELRKDLLDQIREVADANEISVSAFLRESAKRNISAYRAQWAGRPHG